jgi:hypothetical protein
VSIRRCCTYMFIGLMAAVDSRRQRQGRWSRERPRPDRIRLQHRSVSFLCHVHGSRSSLLFGDQGKISSARRLLDIETLAEPHSHHVLQRFGFIFVPIMITFFGTITLVTAWLNNRASFFAIRCLLGLGEAATMPGLAYLLSRVSSSCWYYCDR